jgi:hypothetical protein
MTEILFISSFILLGAFIGVKYFEFVKNRQTSLTKYIASGDHHLIGFGKHLKKEISYINWRNFVLLSIFIWREIKFFSLSFKKRFDSKQSKFFVAVAGEKDLSKRGKPSSFLKSISEHKDKIRKQ